MYLLHLNENENITSLRLSAFEKQAFVFKLGATSSMLNNQLSEGLESPLLVLENLLGILMEFTVIKMQHREKLVTMLSILFKLRQKIMFMCYLCICLQVSVLKFDRKIISMFPSPSLHEESGLCIKAQIMVSISYFAPTI